MLLVVLLKWLERNPFLWTTTVSQLVLFITLSANLKWNIIVAQSSHHPLDVPPSILPDSVVAFLVKATSMSLESVQCIWPLLNDIVWDFHPETLCDADLTFLALKTLYPPTNCCENMECSRMSELHKVEACQVVVYTLNGCEPAWVIHLYCKDCHCNYHHNYYVCDGWRTYYKGIPTFLQVSEHCCVEWQLVEICSATNCSMIFMTTFAHEASSVFGDVGWPFSPTLSMVHVWDMFVLLVLLHDHASRDEVLIIPHTGDQRNHFDMAMQEHNEWIVYHGQDEIDHYCDGWMRVYEEDQDGTPELHKSSHLK
ncbi:hypothetical protein M404DRAFT_170204 [Pisolithus tinctorius Marx 270]|uniref:CxC5 like cysteine cluster associated with KDZ domain-containing protein n=1 Tax=Pisolithus tinctorius Marx 270 TaxID=870435 RepID=A0A0C3MY14_PISTI|nr:hypothetical protein M404DRAFT_170204 [Pisolithus tinctorius Marx 270]